MPVAKERAALVALMDRTVADQEKHANWTYAAIRPQTIPTSYFGQEVAVDCSDGCRMLARVAGVKDDPAGNAYANYGNSSSIWAHSHHIPLTQAEPGDIITFGYSNGEKHACMLYDRDANGWTVWNMGMPGQPAFRPLLLEISGHSGMTLAVCRLNVTDPPPTADDQLREATGYYSWLAWTLGEAAWKGRGKSNRNVRPNVPRLIPGAWWKQRAVFLLNRKKPNP